MEDAEIVDGSIKEDANAKLARLKKEADAKKPADKSAETAEVDPKAVAIAKIDELKIKLGMKDKQTVFAATVKAIEPAIEGKTLNDMTVEQLENIASMLAEMLEKKGK